MNEDESGRFGSYRRREMLGLLGGALATPAYTQNVAGRTRPIPESYAEPPTSGDTSDVQTAASPDGRISVTFDVSGTTPTYSVAFDGTTYVDPSPLGFDFQNQATFGAGSDGTPGASLTVTGSEERTATEDWTPEWDQYDSVSEAYTSLRIGLEEASEPGRTATVEFRVFDDGVGFRFVLGTEFAANSSRAVITAENTHVDFAGDYTAWWIANEFTNPRFEQEYSETPLSEVPAGTETIRPNDNTVRKGAHTPLTVKAGEDAYLSVHQAGLDDYALASLAPTADTGGTTFATQLAPLPDGSKVSWQLPNATPWRTIQVADRPGALVESSLIPLLNEPLDTAALPSDGTGGVDTSWLTPRTYIGVWWTMIAGNANWEYKANAGPDYIHGARTERAKRYMRFAAANGVDSVLVEGWNEGWDTYPGDGTGLKMGVDNSYPDFDVPAVTNYGAGLSSPVELTIHNETAGNVVNYEDEIAAGIFAEYEDAGIRSIKNGYVSDPGLGFEGDGSSPSHTQHCQLAVNHHRSVIQQAAGHRQWLEIHEGIVPTGERRTYPNVGAREVVKAQEYDGFGALGSNVGRDHHVLLPFTRMLAGPLSYQPGIFDITFNDETGDQIQTTRAKQLAMYPTYNAGIQMAADRVEAYIGSSFGVGEYVQTPSGDLSAGMITADEWCDAFGTHYVPLDPNREPSGASVSFTVTDVPSDGTYSLHLRYASDGTDNAQRVIDAGGPQFTLSVNGTTQSVSPSFTNGWDDWRIHTVDVDLVAGDNTVALELQYDDAGGFSGDVGGLNVNTVGVTTQGASAPFPAAYTDLTDAHIAAENVDAHPDFAYIEAVPAGGWDDTTVVDAAIGEYVVTAREKGQSWYVGAMTNDEGRVVTVATDFLSPQSNGWRLDIYTDAVGTDVDTDPTEVRRRSGIVSAGEDVVASMARGGGTAFKLTPATTAEASSLPAYDAPTQSPTYDIDSVADVGEPFITATGQTSGSFVGGTAVAVEVDGQTESVENVRFDPDTGEQTAPFSYTLQSSGSYEVELVDPDTGASLAGPTTVSTSYGELVASFDDAAGDDDGPGGYTYPTNAAFEDGAFDLRSFEVYETADRYRFAFEVANLYDTFGGDNGFSPQHFVVWLRDPSATGGRNTELTGGASLDVAADFDANWHYRIDASGFGAGVVDADGVTVGAPELLVDLADNTVVLSVEKSVFGDIDLLNSEVCPVVGSEDNGRFREVDVTASEWTFGGAKSGAVDNAPGVIDLLTPTGTTQSAALTYSSTSRATLPFTPLYTDRLGDVDHVATFTDGAGDSYGPAADSNGTNAFTYPTTPDMVPDDYDIEQVDLYEGAGTYTFLVRLADLRNPDSFAANSVYGYGLQQLHLYLRDTAAGASNSYCRDGVHAYDDPQKVFAAPYHRRVVAHGFDRANETCGGTYPVVEDGDWNLVADADSGVTTTGHQPIDAIEVTIPSDAFPSDIRDVEFVPLLCSYDGDGAGDVRKVESPSNVADDFTFGGAPADYHHLNVLDMLVPAGTSQASVLDPTASDITADDDFDGYDIPFLSVSDGT